MGAQAPAMPFERAEFVRADQSYSILHRIVGATQVDTILHTFLITNSTTVPGRAMNEINVIGTMNLLAAAGAAGSSVRHIVIKSSTLVYGSAASDPNTFLEDTVRTSPVRNVVERSLIEAEALVRDFAEDNPGTRVTVLRFANVLGTHLTTPISRNLSRPVCPCIFGFDPMVQFVEEEDVVRALLHVTRGASRACTTWPVTDGSPGARSPPCAGPAWYHSPPTASSRSVLLPACSTSQRSSRTCCATAAVLTLGASPRLVSRTTRPAREQCTRSSGKFGFVGNQVVSRCLIPTSMTSSSSSDIRRRS